MPPKLPLPHKRRAFFSSFKITPVVRVIERQLRDKNCLAAIFAPRHQDVSVAPPAEPRGEKKPFFVQILASEKLLKFGEEWAVKIF